MKLEPTDTRPSEILRLVGSGLTAKDAAAKVGISRKTVTRWRQGVAGFSAACDRAAVLSSGTSPAERAALDLLVRTWTPGGLFDSQEEPPTKPPAAVQVAKPEAAPAPAPAVVPDVLDARGKELTKIARRTAEPDAPSEPSPYTTVRPPTQAEWLAEMALLSKDPSAPAQVRSVAIAAVSSALTGGPVRGRQPTEVETAPSQVRGRDPGVPASVWKEARKNFLGPAPDAAPDAARQGDVVEFERAPG